MSLECNESLWIFASGLYQQEVVKKTCLRLQESSDANVNLLLWLTWLATFDIHLERSALTQALRMVGGGHTEMLKSLRRARGHLLTGCNFNRLQMQMIRKHILAAELAAEKVMLQKLQDLTDALPSANDEAEYLTLLDYLQTLSVLDPVGDAGFLLGQGRIFQASFQDDTCTIH